MMSQDRPLRVLLVGGHSPIMTALAAQLQSLGHRVARTVRDTSPSGRVTCPTYRLLAQDYHSHAPRLAEIRRDLGGLDVVVMAIGALGPESALPSNPAEWEESLASNFLGPAHLLSQVVADSRTEGTPCRLIVLSSITVEVAKAGQSIYAAGKAALDRYVQGLALEAPDCPTVLVRLGWVNTRMSHGRSLPRLTMTPHWTAARLLPWVLNQATGIRYLPWWWRLIVMMWNGLPSRWQAKWGQAGLAHPVRRHVA